MAVGEAFLSAAFQVALEKLASPILREFGLRFSVDKDLKKLTRTLSKIQAVLSDAEARQVNDRAVQLWLSELKDIAYDAEDVIDEVLTEASRLKQQNAVSNFLSISKDFLFKLGLVSKLKEINERLDEIAKERDDLGLREGTGVKWSHAGERSPTSSLVDESDVFGREAEKEKMQELLVSDENCKTGVYVIAIVGMGGLGKTTLAQLVYNDEKVKNYFELKMWICVQPDGFDVRRVTRSILQSATGQNFDLMELDVLQTKLRDILKGRKFLLVLDDVWNERQSDWDVLHLPLRAGATGSKILVTTRSEKVSLVMGTIPPHRLEGLSDADCWSLFKQRAFENGNEDAHPNLVPIGKEIVKKCRGLPLAARTLGGLLYLKTEEYEWDMILNSDLWDLEEDKNEILPALRLSYNHLPAHLKQCFVYCSIFPKDYFFQKETLVLLWIAEGFVQCKGRRHLEDVASDYFEDLLLRSFFQHDKINSSKFIMHDLVHDLAQYVAGDICFRLEEDNLQSISERARHASILHDTFKSMVTFEAFSTAPSLRTIVMLKGNEMREIPNAEVLHDLIPNLRCLRVLDLSHIAIKRIGDMVGNLKHLRYLDLSNTYIEMLPHSVCTFYNLQTLILKNCNKLLELPKDMTNLVNLRHLDLTGCWHLTGMPPHIGKLTCLRTLHRFVVGKERRCGIGELKNMVELRATLYIDRLEDVSMVSEAKEANLKNKQHLRRLVLKWSNRQYMPHGTDEELVECLEPHGNIKEIKFDVYHGAKFPNWMGHSSLFHLENVELSHCNYCRILPPLGQLPRLKYLTIDSMSALESISHEFCGEGQTRGFPSLKKLNLEDMKNLKEWHGIEDGDFPLLQELTIINSPNISSLPIFPSLMNLTLDECNELILGSVRLLSSLSSLKLSNFRRLAFLPEGLLQNLSSLKELRIHYFYRLEALKKEVGLQDLMSLHHLEILCCPKLMNFPEEGLPSGLRHFSLCVCNSLPSLPEGLQNLSSLEELSISKCPKLVSFPEKLPSSLKQLRISACASLVSLPSRLHELSSLQSLGINSCHSLASLPEEGLPATVRSLSISDSKLLETRCREGGEDWHKIVHIPSKWIGRF